MTSRDQTQTISSFHSTCLPKWIYSEILENICKQKQDYIVSNNSNGEILSLYNFKNIFVFQTLS